jgi:hypothetical protein
MDAKFNGNPSIGSARLTNGNDNAISLSFLIKKGKHYVRSSGDLPAEQCFDPN